MLRHVAVSAVVAAPLLVVGAARRRQNRPATHDRWPLLGGGGAHTPCRCDGTAAATAARPPAEVDVVVVGGGIAGYRPHTPILHLVESTFSTNL
mmetsp:Transcript_85460/g.240493  ORF Transcript_85460/g.240493 Transcript_85460/m.240493 type:complete len:94 (+) Transcript_85460:60-341(+)